MRKTRNPDALIRIEDAIKVLCREKCYPGMLCPDNYCVEMWDKFEDVERVDAVPVLCKDCKHRDPEDRKCDCGHDIMWQLPRGDDWYCADGERKDGDNG